MVISQNSEDQNLNQSISSVGAFPVPISQTPENEKGSMECIVDYGSKCSGSFAYYDHPSSSWRTWQLCLTGDYAQFLQGWPRAGSMQNGIVSQHQPLVPIINVTGLSSW